jgi:hypothetical protein
MDDLERLGRPGAYRLGELRTPGAGPVPPRPFRPKFARLSRRGPVPAWVLAFLGAIAAVAGGVLAGLVFVPFLVGVLAALVVPWGGWRPRMAPAAAAAVAVIGWGIPLTWQALRSAPPGATPRVLAAVARAAGLPGHGTRGAVVILAAGILQALAGAAVGWILLLAVRRAERSQPAVTAARPRHLREADGLVRLLGGSAGRAERGASGAGQVTTIPGAASAGGSPHPAGPMPTASGTTQAAARTSDRVSGQAAR